VLVPLSKKRDFDRVFSHGRGFRRGPFLLIALPNALGTVRLGIAIPKRLVPLATRRNRMRRLIRAVVLANAERCASHDAVLLLKGKVEIPMRESGASLRKQIDDLIIRAFGDRSERT